VLTTYGAPGSVLLTLFLQEWLHAAKWHIGLVMTMAYLGPLFEPVGAALVERLDRRRGLFLAAWLTNRIPFFALAVVPLLGTSDACRRLGLILTLAVIAFTRIPAALGSPAWWSWMGDLVPERRRSRFFGCRVQLASALAGLSFVIGMTLLQTCGGMQNRALVSALFAAGAAFGVADILLYLKVPEVARRSGRLPDGVTGRRDDGMTGGRSYAVIPSSLHPVIAGLTGPLHHPAFRRLILGMGLWSFSANLIMPFLPVYQRGEVIAGHALGLGVSWLFLAALNVSGNVAAMLTSRWWGRCLDRVGPQRLLLLASGYLFVNLAYLAIPPGRYLALLIGIALVGGALNAAWTVCTYQLLLGVAPRQNRSFYVSAYNSVNGLLMAGGPILGGLLADRLPVLGWRLPGGLTCCYFHLLLVMAAVGGLAGLSVLVSMPSDRKALLPVTPRVVWARLTVVWRSRHRRTPAVAADGPQEYATMEPAQV
jgi:MFS family permease